MPGLTFCLVHFISYADHHLVVLETLQRSVILVPGVLGSPYGWQDEVLKVWVTGRGSVV